MVVDSGLKRSLRMICHWNWSGQAGLITFAVAVLLLLVIGGASLSAMKLLSANKTVVDQRSLETYYTAMAGVQAAIATRMYPTSNYLNWRRPAVAVTPLYNNADEGIACNNNTSPCNANNIVGVYRYFILNGDQAVNAAASTPANIAYWADNSLNAQSEARKIAPELFPTSANDSAAEFVIVSKGSTCIAVDAAGNPTGVAVAGAIQPNKQPAGAIASFPPTCQVVNGVTSVLDELTLITRVLIDPDSPASAPDRIISTEVFKNDANLTVGGGRRVFIPGTGWTNQPFSFENVFAYAGGNNNNPATPSHIVFYDFVNNQIVCSQNINGPTTVISAAACPNIGRKSVIQLYFQGPIDHRSIDPINDYNFAECLDDGAVDPAPSLNCNITSWKWVSGASQRATGYQMIFQPPKNNQLKLLPVLSALPDGNGTQYQIHVRTSALRSWSGATGPSPGGAVIAPFPAVPAGNYVIQFTVSGT